MPKRVRVRARKQVRPKAPQALKHGLTAERALFPGEDPAEYAAFRDRLMSELAPEGALEAALVDRLASTLWRLRRVPILENAFFAYSQHKRLWDDVDLQLDPILELPGPAADLHERTWAPWRSEDHETLKTVGRIVEDALSANILPKLSSYEARLLRQLDKLLGQLERMRDRGGRLPEHRASEAPTAEPDSYALELDTTALGSLAASLSPSEQVMEAPDEAGARKSATFAEPLPAPIWTSFVTMAGLRSVGDRVAQLAEVQRTQVHNRSGNQANHQGGTPRVWRHEGPSADLQALFAYFTSVAP